MHNYVTHESRFLRQTRLNAEIVGLARIAQATPSRLDYIKKYPYFQLQYKYVKACISRNN